MRGVVETVRRWLIRQLIFLFFFNDTATTEIYPLSLHDALPILFVRNPTGVSHSPAEHADLADCEAGVHALALVLEDLDRKSTRLNSSHLVISYAVFCLKK